MHSVVGLVFLILLFTADVVSATCVDVVLENGSEAFAKQLHFQLQSESEIQLKTEDNLGSSDCATVFVRLVEDVAVITPSATSSGDDVTPTLLDLSAIDPAYWARSVALTCATLFYENVPTVEDVADQSTDKSEAHSTSAVVDVTTRIGDRIAPPNQETEAARPEASSPGELARASRRPPVESAPDKGTVSRWAFDVMGGARWVPTYGKDGMGPQLNAGVAYQLRMFMPHLSLVATHCSTPTRTSRHGAQMWGLGGHAALFWKHSVTPVSNLQWGVAVELLGVRAVGNDTSYAAERSRTAAVISVFGHLKGTVALRPSFGLCLGLSVGWALQSIEVQVAGDDVTGMRDALIGVTAGGVFGSTQP
ncbi:MAG: hypothetical protein JXX14_23835 [Deltaproteobacteria bacterium]|nr:hypothetical protein [Deltaproteobacteria bacterium]